MDRMSSFAGGHPIETLTRAGASRTRASWPWPEQQALACASVRKYTLSGTCGEVRQLYGESVRPLRFVVSFLMVIILGLAGAASATEPKGGAGVVSPSGAIGPLQIDRSTGVDVERFAGPAAYIGAGVLRPLIHQFASFIALGYGCRHVRSGGLPTIEYNRSTGAPGDSHVECVTVYLINQRTGTLAGFTTTSRRFETVLGTRPGARLAEAKRRERHYYLSENPPAINERTAGGWLSLDQSTITTATGWRPGKTIVSLTLESRRHPIGLEFV
jgi:hypothetical protein